MNCPNCPNCQLIHDQDFTGTQEKQQLYMNDYCNSSGEAWHSCKRYETSQRLNFCPDFVFPDTLLSVDEIIDRFEEELSLT